MAILIDEGKRVVIQGITGREGQVRTKLMMDYGTNVVGGVTPGRGGQSVHGVPVYDSVKEACDGQGVPDVSVIFVPGPMVRDAALEAIDASVKFLVIVPDRVPQNGASFLGPNTLGCLSPGKAVLGMMGGRAASARQWFKQGPVGVASRSGGMTSSMAYYIGKEGIGQSSIVHVGGDAVVGLPLPDVIRLFQDDAETEAVAMFGEIGTSQEERVAELLKAGVVTKPLVAFIGGKAAKSGTRFSHAGAIVEGDRGTHEGKVKLLREAGAMVVDSFADVPAAVKEALR
jgi:succinyl-CoA synthetase alpha subunit